MSNIKAVYKRPGQVMVMW